MSEQDITQLYRDEMSEVYAEVQIEDIGREHAQYILNGDRESRDRLIVKLLPVVLLLVRKLNVPRDFIDDCIQAGNLAIMQAIESWESAHARTLASWAYVYVRRDILREMDKLREFDNFEELVTEPEWEIPEDDYEPKKVSHEYHIDTILEEVTMQQVKDYISKMDMDTSNLFYLVLERNHNIKEASYILGFSQSKGDRIYQLAISKLRNKLGNY